MILKSLLAFAAMMCLLTAGCDRLLGPGDLKPYNDYMQNYYLTPTTAPASTMKPTIPQALTDYSNVTTDNDRKAKRNDIISGLMAVDDFNFEKYASQTAFAQRGLATLGDITVLGLTSAATITGGQQAKTVLSGIAAVVTGSRIAVDKEVFYDTTLPILLNRMQVLRLRQKKAIHDKYSWSIQDYSLADGISDVYDYFRCGTLAAAEADIANDTVQKAAASQTATSQPTSKLPATEAAVSDATAPEK